MQGLSSSSLSVRIFFIALVEFSRRNCLSRRRERFKRGCVSTQLGSRFSRPQQTVVCSSWNNLGEVTKSGPDFVVSLVGSGVTCAGLSLNSLSLVLVAHRSWGPRRRAGPHVTWQLPGGLQSSPIPRMPRSARNLPLLRKRVQLLADGSEATIAVFCSAGTRHLKRKPGPAPENQQVPGLREDELENPQLANVSPRAASRRG